MRTQWKRGSEPEDFDAKVRARRPVPREEFIHLLGDRVGDDAHHTRRPLRLAGTVAFVTMVVGALALVGGLGYASSVVQQGVDRANELVSPGPETVAVSPADNQYKPGKGCGDTNHLHEKNADCKIKINDVTMKEGNSGTTPFVFTVSLDTFAINTVTVAWVTANGTALAGSDYQPSGGTVTFNPGESSKTVSVSVIGNTVKEPDETFSVLLSNPSVNAVIVDGTGIGTIKNDDR